MDLVLLLVQLGLVLLMVVIPLFSGYDKFVGWSPARRLLALSVAAFLAVVVFTQYRRLRALDADRLADVLPATLAWRGAPWYARALVVTPLEYIVSIAAITTMAVQGVLAARRRAWHRAIPWFAAALLMPALALAIKLRIWR